MRKFKLLLATTVLSLVLYACAWFDTEEIKKIDGSYITYWADMEANRSICKGEINSPSFSCIINSYVYSVGHYSKFIFAKTHFSREPTTYYIIDTLKNIDPRKGVYGPLTKIEFDSLSTKMQIPKVVFNMNFNENP